MDSLGGAFRVPVAGEFGSPPPAPLVLQVAVPDDRVGAVAEDSSSSRCRFVIRLSGNAWSEFIPFLDYDMEIRRVLATTNAIESLNARYRRAVKARGHFPSEQAAMKSPLPRHPIPGPDRARTGTMGNAVEASAQRVRDHLRRPVPGGRNLLMGTAGNTN